MANLTTITFRPVGDGDTAFLFGLFAATQGAQWAALPLDEPSRTALVQMQFAAQRRDYQSRYPRAEDTIVLETGEPIGRLYVDRASTAIHVIDLRLLPARAGAGTGTALLGALVDEARAAGRAVRLHVARTNRARRLYDRLGFRPCEAESDAMYETMEWRASG